MSDKIGRVAAIKNVIALTLGGGILLMPATYRSLGYILGSFFISLISLATFFSIYGLGYAAKICYPNKKASYSQLAMHISPFLKLALDITMIGSNYIVSLLIIRTFAENAKNLVTSCVTSITDSSVCEYIRKGFILFIVVVTSVYYSRKSLRSIEFISTISTVSVFYYILLLAYYCIFYSKPLSTLEGIVFKKDDIGAGFSMVAFAMHCQFSFLPLFNEMEDRSLSGLLFVTMVGSLMAGIIYGGVGIMGYMVTGDEIGPAENMIIYLSNVNNNFYSFIENKTFDKYHIMAKLLNLAFLFIFFGTIVFSTFALIGGLKSLLGIEDDEEEKNGEAQKASFLKRYRGFIPVVLATTYLLLGLKKDLEFKILVSIASAFFVSPLSFFYPALFIWNLTSKRTSAMKIGSYLTMGLSIVTSLCIIVFTEWSK